MQKQISIVLKSPCKKCLSRWGELRKTNQAHPAGLYCKNCGFWLKWVGNGEELKAVIIVETKIKVNSKTNNQPPKIPNKLTSLKRAIELLGNRTSTSLRQKTQNELINLVGVYPSPEQAKVWRQILEKKVKQLNSGTKEQKSKEIPTVITEAEYMEMIGLGHLNYLDIISPDILSDND
jgi:hypothetical protein